MNIQLILKGQTETSQTTEYVWRTTCEDKGLSLLVTNSETEEGQSLVKKLALRTLPALIVDNKVIAVGQPDRVIAEKILHMLKEKTD
ncbi:hypothetical protein MNBD_GAMMA24-2679 [hydrothermal vent metagenome]|uniref:Thioredoxin-like fold domain-containing protein n=1 Tax=hydrothermal vent metagenome TaxID=652676 RepID=A0A3B1C664_9ZZZZ